MTGWHAMPAAHVAPAERGVMRVETADGVVAAPAVYLAPGVPFRLDAGGGLFRALFLEEYLAPPPSHAAPVHALAPAPLNLLVDYIDRTDADCARELADALRLRADKAVAQAAMDAGFADLAYFSRQCRASAGYSPRQCAHFFHRAEALVSTRSRAEVSTRAG